jgi:hypothetical protein
MMLKTPKIRPTVIPTIGPSRMAPITTGICMIVAFAIGRGMNPNPVAPSTTEIADSIPITAICLVPNFLLAILFSNTINLPLSFHQGYES